MTRGNVQKWWPINNYTWNEHVDRENAKAELRGLYADMANGGWFNDSCSSRSLCPQSCGLYCLSSMWIQFRSLTRKRSTRRSLAFSWALSLPAGRHAGDVSDGRRTVLPHRTGLPLRLLERVLRPSFAAVKQDARALSFFSFSPHSAG